MRPQWIYRTILIITAASIALAFTPCLAPAGSINIEWGNQGGPKASDPPQGKSKGPPDHAPAHGYRAKHQYRYYPDSHVYFDVSRRAYFFLEGGSWRMAASLPGSIRLATGFVNLDLDTDKPYTLHHEHKAKYPGKAKGSHKPNKK